MTDWEMAVLVLVMGIVIIWWTLIPTFLSRREPEDQRKE